ncbi:MAG: hypothetical protein IKE51_05060 [Solobacterium sp.]|nr:hypothetical protein [Solobacterium sp.]
MEYDKKSYPMSDDLESGNSFFEHLDSKASLKTLHDTLKEKTLQELIDEVTTQEIELKSFVNALNKKEMK